MDKQMPVCPVEITLRLIGGRWTVLVLRDLLTGRKRFSELKRSLSGVSQHSLTSCLRTMETNGLVVRTVYAEVPPRVEYSLTETGASLRPVLDAMKNWGTQYRADTMRRPR